METTKRIWSFQVTGIEAATPICTEQRVTEYYTVTARWCTDASAQAIKMFKADYRIETIIACDVLP